MREPGGVRPRDSSAGSGPAEPPPDEPLAATPEPADPGTAADQAYFRALEEHLLALRGKSTLLVPADWHAAFEWRRRGIPLDLVRRVMSELAARQKARRSRRGVSSLRYFRAAVERAWEEQLELGAGGVAPRFDPGPPLDDRLRALAAAIPATVPGAEALRAQIAALAGEMEEVETALVELDRRLLAAVDAALSPGARERVARRVEAAIRPLAGALPAEERSLLAERLRAQALRAEGGVPLLSLFAEAALAAGEGGATPPDG